LAYPGFAYRQAFDIIGPAGQGVPHLGFIAGEVIHPSDARAKAPNVIEDGFDHMREDA
jgi:hypothetical protein